MITTKKKHVISHHIMVFSQSKSHQRNKITKKTQIQTDDIDIDFSKVFTDYKKIYNTKIHKEQIPYLQTMYSQFFYSYLFILELKETQGDSPTQISRHTAVSHEINISSKFLSTTCENLTYNELSQIVKQDLQKILTWFIIAHFVPNLDLISLARNIFHPQKSEDENILADKTNYVWDPEKSHLSFINIPIDNSSQAITTISIIRDYVTITLFTNDATPINYNSILADRQGNNCLNSTFIYQEKLNGTRNLTQQDIQTPSHIVNEEIFETMPTTAQQSISPIRPTHTIPKIKTQFFHKQLNNRQ